MGPRTGRTVGGGAQSSRRPVALPAAGALSERELPVSRLAELIEAHVAATSQHLAKLRAAGLVSSRREGTRIFYRIAGPQVRTLLESAALTTDKAVTARNAEATQAGEATAVQKQDARSRSTRAPRTVTAH